MKRNFFSLFIIAVSFLVIGDLQGTRMQPAPTPTPKPGQKIKSMVVTTPTPAPPPKRIKGAVAGPTSTPIRIDKGTKTGPGSIPIKIGKDQIKVAPTQAPIKVIKTQVSTPTPTRGPIKIIKTQVSTPTPTPIFLEKKRLATSTATPIRIPKDGVAGSGGRPGPINLGGPTPGSKKLVPGSNNLPPNPARNVGSNDSVAPAPSQLGVDDIYDVPSSKKLVPGRNKFPSGPASKSIILQSNSNNSVAPAPPPPAGGQPLRTIPDQKVSVVDANTPLGTNTGVAQGTAPVKEVSKLQIYTKNGWGTPSTNLGGEFPAQLATYAMVNPASNNFALQWSRPQGGKEEKGNFWITHVGESLGLQAQPVKMPAGATSVDIPYSINLAPDTYELLVAGESGNSNRVKVSFGGTGTETSLDLPKTGSTGANPPTASASVTITFTHFKPMKGTPGASETSYIHPRLTYRVISSVDMAVPPISFEVNSAAFTDSNTITSSGPASYTPLKLFEKQKKGGGAQLKAGEPASFYVDLDATSDPNWFLAYGQTENATFHWSVPGQTGGSAERPVHTAWP